jgi:tetratricopeptide (TPR) repeat protein
MTEISDPQSLADQANRIYQEGDFENAARLYGEAASAFKATGNELEAAEMKNNQSVACLQNEEAQSALEAAAGTAEIFALAGDPRRQAIALGNEATALQALKRFDEAIAKYRQSAEAFRAADEDQLRASVMQAIAGMQLRRGKIMQALIDLQDGLASVRHPTLKQKFMRSLLRFRTW